MHRNHTLEIFPVELKKRVTALARNSLRPGDVGEGMDMLGKQRKDRGLGEDDKALRRDGRQHGRFFLKAKQRA